MGEFASIDIYLDITEEQPEWDEVDYPFCTLFTEEDDERFDA